MTPKTRTFLERTFSTVVLLGLLAAAVAWNNPAGYAVLICLLCNLTSLEWFHMLRERRSEANRTLALAAGLVYPWLLAGVLLHPDAHEVAGRLLTGGLPLAALVLYAIVAFVCELFRMDYRGRSGRQALASMGVTLLAFVYPVWLFAFALGFLTMGDAAVYFLLWLVLVTKLSDICAYVSGVLVGGRVFSRRFSPVVSPKKTWEGILGSFALTLAAGAGLAQWLLDGVDCWAALLGAEALIFVLAVAGDLAGSLIKRGLEVKDSGALLPGIGGIFDLIDSPAFTVSAAAVLGGLAGIAGLFP